MNPHIDNVLALKILLKLSTPFEETDAFKAGIIDKRGHVIKKYERLSDEEKAHYTLLDRLVFSLKRIINKAPGGENKIKNFVAAYYLVKEAVELEIDVIYEESFQMFVEDVDLSINEELCALYEDAPTNSAGSMPDSGGVAKKEKPIMKLARRKAFKEYANEKG